MADASRIPLEAASPPMPILASSFAVAEKLAVATAGSMPSCSWVGDGSVVVGRAEKGRFGTTKLAAGAANRHATTNLVRMLIWVNLLMIPVGKARPFYCCRPPAQQRRSGGVRKEHDDAIVMVQETRNVKGDTLVP